MKTRIIFGSVMVALVAGLFAVDYLLESRVCVSILVCIMALAGWYELAAMSGISSRERGGGRGLLLVGTLGTAYFLGIGWGVAAAGIPVADEGFLIAAGLVGTILGGFAAVGFREGFERAVSPFLAMVLGTLVMGLVFSYVLRIYHLPRGHVLGIAFFFGTKGNDIVAYFVGRAVGRVRFLKVSPKKTLEGCASAVLFSVLYYLALSAWDPELFFPWSGAIGAGIILSITSQLGDLFESLLKRGYEVKDSSVLLPEFGGVLDMVDSLLFSAFVFWFLLSLV